MAKMKYRVELMTQPGVSQAGTLSRFRIERPDYALGGDDNTLVQCWEYRRLDQAVTLINRLSEVVTGDVKLWSRLQ